MEWVRDVLVPVTDTCLVPVVLKVQESVALPEPVMVGGETLHDEVVFVARLTVPANPLIAVTVIVEVPAALTLTVTRVGLALRAKSCTTKVRIVE